MDRPKCPNSARCGGGDHEERGQLLIRLGMEGWKIHSGRDSSGPTVAGRAHRYRLLRSRRSSDAFPVANDEVLVNVGRLNQLQELNLYRSAVSDAGLSHLNGLTQLTRLYLGKTAVSDAGLAHLGVLGNLHELHLDSTNVSDAGLAQLKRLDKLTKLDLRNTQVTDAGLVHVQGLTDLSRLALEGSSVTNAAIKKLKQAFPNLKADIYGPFD